MSEIDVALGSLVDSVVQVITDDKRVFVGNLHSCDQLWNIVMTDCYERIYSKGSGVERVEMGVYFIRGTNVGVIGQVDENVED